MSREKMLSDEEIKAYCWEGAMPHIQVNNRERMTLREHREVLVNVLHTVRTQERWQYDSDAPGAKNLECNHGLCGDIPEHYPRPEMHTFPLAFKHEGRVSPIGRPDGFHCPLDVDDGTRGERGCFYRCRIFQRKSGRRPNRAQTIRMYESEIARVGAAITAQEDQ